MTDREIVQYIDQYCVKTGDIEVKNIRPDGQYTLIVPLFNGELGENQIATMDLEFVFDGEEATLLNFPKNLLSGEDYSSITEAIEEEMMQAQEFMRLGEKYGFKVMAQGCKLNLYAKNTDNQWTQWISYDSQKNNVSCRGNTDYLNIWLGDTRKDMTPEKCLSFVEELNQTFFLTGNDRFLIKDLIDPEDWQEIAQVRDAYKDERYAGKTALNLDSRIHMAASQAVQPSSKDQVQSKGPALDDVGRT